MAIRMIGDTESVFKTSNSHVVNVGHKLAGMIATHLSHVEVVKLLFGYRITVSFEKVGRAADIVGTIAQSYTSPLLYLNEFMSDNESFDFTMPQLSRPDWSGVDMAELFVYVEGGDGFVYRTSAALRLEDSPTTEHRNGAQRRLALEVRYGRENVEHVNPEPVEASLRFEWLTGFSKLSKAGNDRFIRHSVNSIRRGDPPALLLAANIMIRVPPRSNFNYFSPW